MARKNKELERIGFGIEGIKKEIKMVKEQILEEVRTEQYGKAFGLIKYKEGLSQALWYLNVFGIIKEGFKNERPAENDK